jgi:hypothetical protein
VANGGQRKGSLACTSMRMLVPASNEVQAAIISMSTGTGC